MEYDQFNSDVFQIGKSFETGLISFESLTDSQKYDLSKYFAIKKDMLDNKIIETKNSLATMNNKLDNLYNEIVHSK